jgi:hypothetical protein
LIDHRLLHERVFQRVNRAGDELGSIAFAPMRITTMPPTASPVAL